MIAVPPWTNKLPVKVSLAVNISVPLSDLVEVGSGAADAHRPGSRWHRWPHQSLKPSGIGIARLLVTLPLICKVPPLRVTAPELAPSAESFVMINEPLSLMNTPPVKLLLVSNVREPVFDFTREVTPVIPPAPAMAIRQGAVHHDREGEKGGVQGDISRLRIDEIVGQSVVESHGIAGNHAAIGVLLKDRVPAREEVGPVGGGQIPTAAAHSVPDQVVGSSGNNDINRRIGGII